MITLAKYKSTAIELGKRIIKVIQFGPKTGKQISPFGFDSQPLENTTAIFTNTSNDDESLILGYINANQLAEAGESRMYALNGSKSVVGYVMCKASGITEINGNQYTAVRFSPLKTAIDAKDTLVQQELAKIATALAGVGGVYVPGTITTNLTNSESPTVKLK